MQVGNPGCMQVGLNAGGPSISQLLSLRSRRASVLLQCSRRVMGRARIAHGRACMCRPTWFGRHACLRALSLFGMRCAADEPVKPFEQLDDDSLRLLDAIQERQAYIQAGA